VCVYIHKHLYIYGYRYRYRYLQGLWPVCAALYALFPHLRERCATLLLVGLEHGDDGAVEVDGRVELATAVLRAEIAFVAIIVR